MSFVEYKGLVCCESLRACFDFQSNYEETHKMHRHPQQLSIVSDSFSDKIE